MQSIKLKEKDALLVKLQNAEEYLVEFKKINEGEKEKLNNYIFEINKLNEIKSSILLFLSKNKEKEKANDDLILLEQIRKVQQTNLKSTNENLENGNNLIDQHKLINTELNNAEIETRQIEILESLQKKMGNNFDYH